MKGRPEGSIVRNRLVQMLQVLGTSYGYELYNHYREVFGNVHIRTIYYNLKKGIEKEEIIVVDVAREIGDYSWGDEVQKVYYTAGPFAKTAAPAKDLEKLKILKKKARKVEVDWAKEIKILADKLRKDIIDYKERFNVLSSQGRKILKQRIAEKLRKIKEFNNGRITGDELSRIIEGINPDTL